MGEEYGLVLYRDQAELDQSEQMPCRFRKTWIWTEDVSCIAISFDITSVYSVGESFQKDSKREVNASTWAYKSTLSLQNNIIS